MPKLCDFTSVGLVARDTQGRYALLRRAKVPYGIAPPAGHIDDHGSAEQAMIDEAREELGLVVEPSDLRPTSIQGRRVIAKCSRINSAYHEWTVFESTLPSGTVLTPNVIETKGAGWYTPDQLHELARRTMQYEAGRISEEEWESSPGLEPLWLSFLIELKCVAKTD